MNARCSYASLFVYKIFNHYSVRARAVLFARSRTCATFHCSIFCPRPIQPLTGSRDFLENFPQRTQRLFSTASDKNEIDKHRERVRQELKSYLKQHRVRLRDTEQRIKETGSVIIKDIKETKDKVKERVGEIIEVSV